VDNIAAAQARAEKGGRLANGRPCWRVRSTAQKASQARRKKNPLGLFSRRGPMRRLLGRDSWVSSSKHRSRY
jgi:hypothetical protein